MTNDVDLIATCWTIAGDFLPGADRTACPLPLGERIAAAASAGYTGIGFWHGDLEYMGDWFTEGERRQRADAMRRGLFAAADALGARHIKVMAPFGNEGWPRQRLIDEYGSLCAEAATHGLLMPIEMIPFSDLPTLDAVLDIAAGAGAANGGLLIDIWHVVRSGASHEDILKVPARYILAAELDDAELALHGDMTEDTMHHRRLCGEGEFDVPAFIDAMKRAGYRGPYGVEILSREHRRLPVAEAARRSFETARAQFTGSAR